jgi:hypothetical protein
MKTTLKKMLGLATLGMALLTNPAPSWAGAQYSAEVAIIHDDTFYAMGSMVAARYSKDSNQTIGCTAYTLPSYSWTSCYAMDRAGNTLACGSGDPHWASVVQAMTSSSFINFTVAYNNGGECSHIIIKNDSTFLK